MADTPPLEPDTRSVRDLFEQLLPLSEPARARLLRVTAAERPWLAREVEELLTAHQTADSDAIFPLPPALLAPEPGSRVGPWRVVGFVAAGGMGVVLRAVKADDEQVTDGTPTEVALKLPRGSVHTHATLARRFARESRLLGDIVHPGVARLIATGITDDGRPWMAMAFVDGERIDVWCDRRGLGLTARVHVFVAVCRTVGAIHARGIVHRDLKPTNLLVTADGTPRVVDFGLAVRQGDDEADDDPLTTPGATPFTPGYASPEQARGERVGPVSDVYALGVVLHELCLGERPRSGTSPAALLRELQETNPPAAEAIAAARATTVLALREDLESGLDAIVQASLQHAPELRLPDAHQLADALEVWLTRTPRSRAPHPGGALPGTPRRWLRGATLAVVGALGVALAWRIGLSREAHAPRGGAEAVANAGSRAIAVLPFASYGARATDLGGGVADLLARALDGAGPLRMVDPITVRRLLAADSLLPADSARAKVARRLGAGGVIEGTVTAAPDGRLLIVGEWREPSGRVRASARVNGPPDSLFTLVDDLARGLLEDSRVALSSALRTTTSLSAFKAYLQGEEDVQAGRFPDAVTAFERAVRLDSTFALAYFRMAQAAQSADASPRRMLAALDEARRYAGRLSEPDRLRLFAFAYARDRNFAAAESSYRALLHWDGDDADALFSLADLRFHQNPYRGRSIRESREGFLRTDGIGPNAYESTHHLGVLALRDRDFTALAALVRRQRAADPTSSLLTSLRLWSAALRATPPLRDTVAADAAKASQTSRIYTLWRLGTHAPESPLLLPVADSIAAASEGALRAFAHLTAADALATRGDWRGALSRLDRAAADAPLRVLEVRAHWATLPFRATSPAERRSARAALAAWTPVRSPTPPNPPFDEHPPGTEWFPRHYLLALLDATLGDTAAALARAAALDATAGPSDTQQYARSLAAGVRARIAFDAGDPTRALALLERGGVEVSRDYAPVHLGTQVPERWLRAEALRRLGRFDEARGWYESIAELSPHEGVYRAAAARALAGMP